MVDVVRVRELRAKIRDIIGLDVGKPITDEMLSAPLAILAEVWTLRIICSPERHTGSMDPATLMKAISAEFSDLMQQQAKKWLPHAKTFSMFHDPNDQKP